MKTSAPNDGFTLMELLVVILIMGVLVTLTFPAYNLVLEKGRTARCQSNLRQLYAATMNYVVENGMRTANATYPLCATVEVQGGAAPGWIHWSAVTNLPPGPSPQKTTFWTGTNALRCIRNGSLFPYLGDASVYLCPTFGKRSVCRQTDAVRSYVMNSQMSGASLYTTNSVGNLQPSRIMLFADGGLGRRLPLTASGTNISRYGLVDESTSLPLYDNTYSNGLGAGYYNRSSDGALVGILSGGLIIEHIGEYHSGNEGNAIFADGHVLKMSYTNTLSICAGSY